MKFNVDVDVSSKVNAAVPKVDVNAAAGAAAGAAANVANAAAGAAASAVEIAQTLAGIAGGVAGAVGAGLAVGAALKSSGGAALGGGVKLDAHANAAALSDESLGLPDEAEESPMEPHLILDGALDPLDYPFSL